MADLKGFDASKALDEIKGDRNLSIIAGGAVLVLVGVFLPWYSIDILGVSFSPGLDSTGILLILFSAGAVLSGLNVLKHDLKMSRIVSIVTAALALLIVIGNSPDGDLGAVVSTGIGYWASLAGAIAMVAGSVMRKQATKATRSPKPSAPKSGKDS